MSKYLNNWGEMLDDVPFLWYNTDGIMKIKMKNKIIKLVSLVMMGVMMLGNSVAFANEQEVSVSSVNAVGNVQFFVPTNAIDDNEGSAWIAGNCSNNQQSPCWIEFDFGSETSISKIRSWPQTNPAGQFADWIIQGSNDQSNYTDVGTIDHVGTLHGQGNASFQNFNNTSVSTNANGKLNSPIITYRYIRLVNPNGNNNMGLVEIDFYYDSSLNSPSVPEFSTYIYLTTLVFTFAIGYRRLPNFIKNEK